MQRPRRYRGVLLIYLAILTAAEIAVTFFSPALVFPLHGGLIVLAAVYPAIAHRLDRDQVEDRQLTVVALALSVAPLIRIISLTLPLAQFEPTLRYVAAGIPMLLGGLLAARAAGLGAEQIGLAWRRTGWQLVAILVSVAMGFAEYMILRPEAIGPFPWTAAGAVPALSIALSTGLPEELIFRGVMQTALRPIIGRWNWVYVSAIFAVLHIGYQSYVDALFVFAVGLFYGWIFERTRSIIGVAIGHGVANMILFLVAPNIGAAVALPSMDQTAQLVIAVGASAALVIAGLIFWRSRIGVTGIQPRAYPGR